MPAGKDARLFPESADHAGITLEIHHADLPVAGKLQILSGNIHQHGKPLSAPPVAKYLKAGIPGEKLLAGCAVSIRKVSGQFRSCHKFPPGLFHPTAGHQCFVNIFILPHFSGCVNRKSRRPFPNLTHISEKKQSYSFRFRQSYGCGKKCAFFRKSEKEKQAMKSNNQINVPQAKQAMEQFKMQAAQEVGVNLQNGYNGHLTSREAGSVGGQMVKKMIEAYEQGMV